MAIENNNFGGVLPTEVARVFETSNLFLTSQNIPCCMHKFN